MIKWEHSIFMLPFALMRSHAGSEPPASARAFAWIIVAMVSARSAAMAFNRYADASIDAANPPNSDALSSRQGRSLPVL